MYETIKYPYNINAALTRMVVPLIFLIITATNFKTAYMAGITVSWLIIGTADLIFIAQIIFIFINRLLPALTKRAALELNPEGIADYIRKVEISWKDIAAINFEQGRRTKMVIDLKEETDYGKEIAINLNWVQGNDLEICQTTQAYFEEMTKLR
ncbi:MAG: hypothetical protein ABI367_15970 [Mucilaginibacter sp.]